MYTIKELGNTKRKREDFLIKTKERKEKKMKERRKQDGITLVALVITVIVLIILAGVTLSTLVGDNGIITKAKEGKQNMTNAVAEEDKSLQNMLNKMNEIEARGGEIEIPDPPTEPEEPTYPTIESTISEGKYVWYTDAYGTQQKCIVLYGPENENYSSYGIQIITADTVTDDYTLGVDDDFNASRDAYNNAITTLNTEAEKYRKKDDLIAEVARCVGSMPDNPNYDGAGYTQSDSWPSSYNNTLKDWDKNYEADYNQMQSIVINGQGINKIGKYYWLASRSTGGGDYGSYIIESFHIRFVNSSGADGSYGLCSVYSDGRTSGSSVSSGLRLVFRLKSGIKVIGGDGSEGNPYTLAP